MADIDNYLGGNEADKTKLSGGSTTDGGYGYASDITSRFQINQLGNLELVLNEGTVLLEDL